MCTKDLSIAWKFWPEIVFRFTQMTVVLAPKFCLILLGRGIVKIDLY